MQVTLTATGENTSELKEVTNSTSATFPLPIPKSTLIAALRAILAEPERRDLGAGPVLIERMRDGIRVNLLNGGFFLRYQHVFPLILGEE